MIYNYTIIRSKRKTLAIEITKEPAVVIRAPLHASKQDIEKMISKHGTWIQSHLDKQRLRNEAMPEPSPEEQKLLRQQAKEHIPARVAFFSRIMALDPAAVTITSAAKRFGSCSGKNRLSFSWRLMRYPDPAIDYVVVHELAHIRHKNHGREFYALIESVLPDYKERKKLLKS